MVDVPMTAAVMGPPSTLAYELITTGRLVHDDDPVLAEHVANTTAVLTDRGMKVTRSKHGSTRPNVACGGDGPGGRDGDAGRARPVRPQAPEGRGVLMLDPMRPSRSSRARSRWWLARLGKRLDDRRDRMKRYEAYYAGRQPLAFASDTFRAAFGDRFREFSSNFMSLVVDAHRERLQVQGIRIGDNRGGDTDAWDWWQRNRLDAESQIAHTESLVKGLAYVLVWPDPDERRARGHDRVGAPGRGRDRARQELEAAGRAQALARRRRPLPRRAVPARRHLQVPLGAEGGRVQRRLLGPVAQWTRDEIPGEPWPVRNPLGVIPIVPIVNRPRLAGTVLDAHGRPIPGVVGPDDGQSEIAMVMSNQDAINKLRADTINASDFASFRQRWIKNWEIEIDEKTGQPVEPFRAAVDRLWMLPPPDPEDPNPPKVELGEFEQTDLAPIIAGIQMEVQHLGAISRTPYHYLLPQSGQPPVGRVAQVRRDRPRGQGRSTRCSTRASPGRRSSGSTSRSATTRAGRTSAPRSSGRTPRAGPRPCTPTRWPSGRPRHRRGDHLGGARPLAAPDRPHRERLAAAPPAPAQPAPAPAVAPGAGRPGALARQEATRTTMPETTTPAGATPAAAGATPAQTTPVSPASDPTPATATPATGDGRARRGREEGDRRRAEGREGSPGRPPGRPDRARGPQGRRPVRDREGDQRGHQRRDGCGTGQVADEHPVGPRRGRPPRGRATNETLLELALRSDLIAGLTVDESGKVTDLDKAVEQLQAGHPRDVHPAGPAAPPGGPDGAPAQAKDLESAIASALREALTGRRRPPTRPPECE